MIAENLGASPPLSGFPPQSQPGVSAADESLTGPSPNAFQHGCSSVGKVMTIQDRKEVKDRLERLRSAYRGATGPEFELLEELAIEETLLHRCQTISLAMLDEMQVAAEVQWDLDEAIAAEELAATLPRAPGVVSRQLAQTPQGAEALGSRWDGLKAVLIAGAEWTDPQWNLALDLLGVPTELRIRGQTVLDGRPGEDPRAVALAVVERELAKLRSESATAARQKRDTVRRTMAMQGAPLRLSREYRLIKRYEAMHARRVRELRAELFRIRTLRDEKDAAQEREEAARLRQSEARRRARRARAEAEDEAALRGSFEHDPWMDELRSRFQGSPNASTAPRRDREAERPRKEAEREAPRQR